MSLRFDLYFMEGQEGAWSDIVPILTRWYDLAVLIFEVCACSISSVLGLVAYRSQFGWNRVMVTEVKEAD